MRSKLTIIFLLLALAVAIGSYFFGRALWKPLSVKVAVNAGRVDKLAHRPISLTDDEALVG